MATTNYSAIDLKNRSSASKFKFAIVTSIWNNEVTFNLKQGAYDTLTYFGAKKSNLFTFDVPGAFELTFTAAQLVKSKKYHAVIVLGCVIQGETRHFDFVCQGVTQGITTLNLTSNIPVIFGLLTDNTLQQSLARSGGKLGNKGVECAVSAIKMALLASEINKKSN